MNNQEDISFEEKNAIEELKTRYGIVFSKKNGKYSLEDYKKEDIFFWNIEDVPTLMEEKGLSIVDFLHFVERTTEEFVRYSKENWIPKKMDLTRIKADIQVESYLEEDEDCEVFWRSLYFDANARTPEYEKMLEEVSELALSREEFKKQKNMRGNCSYGSYRDDFVKNYSFIKYGINIDEIYDTLALNPDMIDIYSEW